MFLRFYKNSQMLIVSMFVTKRAYTLISIYKPNCRIIGGIFLLLLSSSLRLPRFAIIPSLFFYTILLYF